MGPGLPSLSPPSLTRQGLQSIVDRVCPLAVPQVVLTSDGVQRLRKRRPLDALVEAAILEAQLQPPHAGLSPAFSPAAAAGLPPAGAGPMPELFRHYGADEACCMCLMAAGMQASGTLTFERSLPATLPATLAVWAWRLGGTPQTVEQGAGQQVGTAQGQAIKEPTLLFSGRHS